MPRRAEERGKDRATRLAELTEHLFRRESGRLVVALTRLFGVHNLALAEDVVQDAFCRALGVWDTQDIPENPAAWLMAAARNRALDIVRRERTAHRFASEVGRLLETEWTTVPVVHEAFEPGVIRDEQLRMMFSCCDPHLTEETQVALILNILCGLPAREIAGAFLTGQAAMEKRIARGKTALAAAERLFDLRATEFPTRLTAVRRALYLLFNEGYQGASATAAVRAELCREAMRLVDLLLEHPPAATPETYALAALMCLHAARLPARLDAAGDLTPLADQHRAHWDSHLVARGLARLEQSATGVAVSAYHVEATIAATHAAAPSVPATDWETIVSLYDRLMAIAPSPVVALNRAIAVAQRDGAERGLEALTAIVDQGRLARYPFYPAAMGELELERGKREAARRHFKAALALARNRTERRHLEKRLRACGTE
jgi:RNA polymerase sigma factor (sigma-70 family)